MTELNSDMNDSIEDIDEKLEQQSQRISQMADELDEQLKDQDPHELLHSLGGIHLLRTQMLTSLERALSLAERIADDADDRSTVLSHAILANRLRDILNHE